MSDFFLQTTIEANALMMYGLYRVIEKDGRDLKPL